MRKGKYGICLSFYAILAFVFALVGQTLLCALLLGFVVIAERDNWTSRQVMQGFFLALLNTVVKEAVASMNIFNGVGFLGDAINVIVNLITGAITLVILIFVIVAIINVSKGKEAGIPVFSKMASKAFGIVEKKIYTQMGNL